MILSEYGFKPILIERGSKVEDRVKKVKAFWDSKKLDIDTNVQFGEGGAGTFSDGKLTTRINDRRCEEVLKLPAGFRICQIVVYPAKFSKKYDGFYNTNKTIISQYKGK